MDVDGNDNADYNGRYGPSDDWNGYPHFENENGMHLYFLDTDENPDGYWQFDSREQDGTNDWYDGGYMYCSEGVDQYEGNYDEDGYGEFDFTSGTIGI